MGDVFGGINNIGKIDIEIAVFLSGTLVNNVGESHIERSKQVFHGRSGLELKSID